MIRLTDGEYKFLNPGDIIYIEADARYCNITCINKKIYKLVSPSFGQIEKQLPGEVFLPIKKGFTVSRLYIRGMNKQKTRLYCAEDISLVIARGCVPLIEKRWRLKPSRGKNDE